MTAIAYLCDIQEDWVHLVSILVVERLDIGASDVIAALILIVHGVPNANPRGQYWSISSFK